MQSILRLHARMVGGSSSLAAIVLRCACVPLALAFGTASGLRTFLYDLHVWPCRSRRVPVPVVSVGNLSAGGTGKSLLAARLAQELIQQGRRPAIVSRGYGAATHGDGRALGDEAREHATRLGGEVDLVADLDRHRGARRAIAEGADVIVLDDGFQHRRLARDLDVLCLDLLTPPGARPLLPLGLAREPLRAARRADIVLLTRADLVPASVADELEAALRRSGFAGPILRAAHRPSRLVALDSFCPPGDGADDTEDTPGVRLPESLEDRRVLLVSALGNPSGFEGTASALGAVVIEHITRPDHHAWSAADVASIQARVREHQAELVVTTGKDAVKLAPHAPGQGWWVLEVELATPDGDDALRKALCELQASAR